MALFSVFDHPHLIQVVTGAEGHYDGDARTWTAPASTVTAIKGHVIHRRGENEGEWKTRGDAGWLKDGDIGLATTATINRHDHVRIHDDDTGTNYRLYRVESQQFSGRWLASMTASTPRIYYVLREVQSTHGV